MADILKYRDKETGELREIDLVNNIMLSHKPGGHIEESRVERGDEQLELSLSAYANHHSQMRALSAWEGKAVTMDLGISDVHQDMPLANYASGYRNADGVADIVAPIVPSVKPSAKYYQWNSADAFQAVENTATAPGETVPEVSPRLSNANYSTVEYALGAFVPTEVEASADAPLRPLQAAVRRVITALMISRELRVYAALSSASYASAQIVDLTGSPATLKWNGGSASDPVANVHTLMENAYMEATDMICSRRVYNWFSRNAQVQKFIQFKSAVRPLPAASDMSAILELPPIQVAAMKRLNPTTGINDYIWGNNVYLIRRAPAIPADGQDISSMYTFRWNGGPTPDGSVQGGMLVRTFYDHKRGPRGGMTTVVAHNDAEIVTSTLVGGVILGAFQ